MSRTTNQSNRGFTIVELLIVIVIIAILAAISIVAYNGIQDRARNSTAKDIATQLANKAETWKSVIGTYPTYANVKTDKLANTQVTEAKIEDDIVNKITAAETTVVPTAYSETAMIRYDPCTGDGIRISYWQSGGIQSIVRGTADTGCAAQ